MAELSRAYAGGRYGSCGLDCRRTAARLALAQFSSLSNGNVGDSVADLEWKFAKASQACCLCQGALSPGQPFYSALFVIGEKFSRRDYCVPCFQGGPPENVFYFWKAALSDPGAKERSARRGLVVDTEYVLEFFERLGEGATPAEPDGVGAQRLVFRYVLALMLARKKVLVFEGKVADAAGSGIHIFREKRGGQKHEVREPALSPEAIAAASAELGVLLGVTPPPQEHTEARAVGQGAADATRRTSE